MVIDLRALEKGARWTDKSVLIWIVDLSLVIIGKNEFVVPPVSRPPIDVWTNQPTFREKMIDGTRIENCVWISGVAHRIRKQTADPKLVIRRPASVRNQGRIAVIVIRASVVGVEATRAAS